MVKKKVEVKAHVLLLKHEKLEEKAVENLLKKYNVKKEQLPSIYKKDPGLRELSKSKCESGDVIRVVRDSPTSGKTKFYRVVVDA